MMGARVSTGKDSKQDYRTPDDLFEVVNRRFGPVIFDLAAHAANKRHPRYFAPKEFVEPLDKEISLKDFRELVNTLCERGVSKEDADKLLALQQAKEARVANAIESPRADEICMKNSDKEAYGFDAFNQDWAKLSTHSEWREERLGPGLLWLNPPFSEISPWAERCTSEARRGAYIALLTPAAVGANWFVRHMAPEADVYLLNGRPSFIPGQAYNKDCMLALYGPRPFTQGKIALWDWRKDSILQEWSR
jgi:hypothetical protein